MEHGGLLKCFSDQFNAKTIAFRTAPLFKGRIVSTRGLAGRMVANWWLSHSQAQAFIRTKAHESK